MEEKRSEEKGTVSVVVAHKERCDASCKAALAKYRNNY